MNAGNQTEIAAFLSESGSYGISSPVERIDTHISIVFLAGERAYKLKRDIRFSYLDYSDPEERRRFCEAEVAINRRTAPDLYEGVTPVVRRPNGNLALGEPGTPLDWLVVMKRFDQAGIWDAMAERGELTPALVSELADIVARFHMDVDAVTTDDGAGSIRRVVDENELELRRFVPNIFDAGEVRRLGDACRGALGETARLLDNRGAAGMVRRCHGDLHLRNICQVDGRPTLFDAIEFSDDIAVIDILYDLAFLIMDLEHRDLRPLANLLLNRYLSLTRDYDGLAAMPLFLACRAGIRAHVTTAAAANSDDREPRSEEARSYLHLALTLLDSPLPRLVVIGGPSGSGKSSVARRLAPLLGAVPGAVHLQSDVIRKRLAGITPEIELAQEHYGEEITRAVYDRLHTDAERALKAGCTVIGDATYLDPGQRGRVETLALKAGVPFQGLWLTAPAETLESRVSGRGEDASDADVGVLKKQLTADVSDVGWTKLPACGDLDQTVARALHELERDVPVTEVDCA